MYEVSPTGKAFHINLVNLFDAAWHDINTLPTSGIFDDVYVDANRSAWENFNGEHMVALAWAMSFQAKYVAEFKNLTTESYSELKINRIYKAYQMNESLPICFLIIRVSEDELLLIGKETNTGMCSYGLVDAGKKRITTNVGLNNQTQTLGDTYGPLLFNYLSMSF